MGGEERMQRLAALGPEAFPVLVRKIEKEDHYGLVYLLPVFERQLVEKTLARWLRERRAVPFDERIAREYQNVGYLLD
jgi:hypothetical protein